MAESLDILRESIKDAQRRGIESIRCDVLLAHLDQLEKAVDPDQEPPSKNSKLIGIRDSDGNWKDSRP